MTWSSAKLAPGKYGVFVTGGGWRPLSKKMRVTAGTEMIERSIWTNTQSDMKEAGFDLGVMEVTEAQIGVTLACIETHPPQKGNKEREGFISGIKFTPLKTP